MPGAMDRRFRKNAPFGMAPMAEPAPRSAPNLAYVQLAVWAVALGLIAVRWTIKGPPYLEALLMIPFCLTATLLWGTLPSTVSLPQVALAMATRPTIAACSHGRLPPAATE
jgi:hypothetical protein